jgi:hypothetical protein
VQTLHIHCIRAIKSEILRSALNSLPLKPQTPPLPPELLELIILLSLKLSTPLPPTSLALLTSSSPYGALLDHIPRISALLSTHLHSQALALTRLLHPTTNPSYLHRTVPKIPSALNTLSATISSQKASLESARLALVPLTTKVLEHYRTATELTIRILEQNKHGQLARFIKSKSELLCADAKQEELNAKIVNLTARNTIYTAEVSNALVNYKEQLRDGRARLRQRQKDAEKELERYGVGREGKEKVMKEIARVYGEMGRQIREVRKDMERLKGA